MQFFAPEFAAGAQKFLQTRSDAHVLTSWVGPIDVSMDVSYEQCTI